MNPLANWKKEWNEKKASDIHNECVKAFSVERIDGCDYITLFGIVVSRECDDDILERLNEFRESYYQQRLNGKDI